MSSRSKCELSAATRRIKKSTLLGAFSKTRPEYSQGGATRAELKLSQEAVRFHLQLPEFSLRAVGGDRQGIAQVQAEHLHEPLSVGGVPAVGDLNGEGAGGDQRDEILDILHTAEPDVKFQDYRPLGLYKLPNLVYNKGYGPSSVPHHHLFADELHYSSFC